MAVKKKPKASQTSARAKDVASDGTAVRDRVRDLSVAALRDRKLSLNDVPKLVNEVLEGAVEGVDASIPKSSKNVLREVFEGLSEGVHAIAAAGSSVVKDVRERGETVAGRNASDATRRIRAANQEFLGAVKSFAGKTSKQVREELHALVAKAEKTTPKVLDSARTAAKAADGRLIELSGETARAGVRAVRRAAGALAMGAGGFLEGLAEAIAPKAAVNPPARSAPKPRATKAARRTKPKKAAAKSKPAKRRKV